MYHSPGRLRGLDVDEVWPDAWKDGRSHPFADDAHGIGYAARMGRKDGNIQWLAGRQENYPEQAEEREGNIWPSRWHLGNRRLQRRKCRPRIVRCHWEEEPHFLLHPWLPHNNVGKPGRPGCHWDPTHWQLEHPALAKGWSIPTGAGSPTDVGSTPDSYDEPATVGCRRREKKSAGWPCTISTSTWAEGTPNPHRGRCFLISRSNREFSKATSEGATKTTWLSSWLGDPRAAHRIQVVFVFMSRSQRNDVFFIGMDEWQWCVSPLDHPRAGGCWKLHFWLGTISA